MITVRVAGTTNMEMHPLGLRFALDEAGSGVLFILGDQDTELAAYADGAWLSARKDAGDGTNA